MYKVQAPSKILKIQILFYQYIYIIIYKISSFSEQIILFKRKWL